MKNEKKKIDCSAIKKFLQLDKVSSIFMVAVNRKIWRNLISSDVWKELFEKDLVSAVHLLFTLIIVAICLYCHKVYGYGGMILTLGIFAYFNVFVGTIAVRNNTDAKIELCKNIVKLWAMGIGVGFIIASMWNGWSSFFSVCGSLGFIVLPVMLLQSDFRQKLSPVLSGMFNVGSMDDMLPGCLGVVIGFMVLLLIAGFAGSIMLFVFYFGMIVDICEFGKDRNNFEEGCENVLDDKLSVDQLIHRVTQQAEMESQMKTKKEESILID